MKRIYQISLMLLFPLLVVTHAYAADRVVNLIVAYKMVNFTGRPVRAIAVNDQIPGPTLHFKEGEHVTINVYNHLNEGTSIHWHGIILPWQMDGVSWVTQKPIPPGGVFHYQYTLHQSGTYWYHSHRDLQEQQGLYGAYIIDPPHERYKYNKDIPIVLSDWINTNPDKVYANLKKDGDYYEPRFPMQPSLMQFLKDRRDAQTPAQRQAVWDSYMSMQHMRMSNYDLSDVAYDTFLLNGHPPNAPWIYTVKVGDTVRLRFVGAGANTIFHVKIPGEKMQIIHVQGNDVKPYYVDYFSVDPGETYDVLLKIKRNAPYIIYAESNDKVGKVYGALVTNLHQIVDFSSVPSFPDPQPQPAMKMSNMKMAQSDMQNMNMKNMNMSGMSHMSNMLMHNMSMNNKSMSGMSKPEMSKMSMSNMSSMPMQNMSMSGMSMSNMSNMQMAPAILPNRMNNANFRYPNLISPVKTNNPNISVHTYQITLTGYMNHYIWFINGVPEYDAKPIMIENGQWYRFVFVNKTMMHHPMHLHGHWFILRNGHGAYDPLLHTIDVPPGKMVTVDFHANMDGQWYFHCHFLYHMKAGMANIVRYVSPYDYPSYLQGHKTKEWFFANELDLNGDFYHDVYQTMFNGLYGPDFNKLQLHVQEAEMDQGTVDTADIDIFYWHLISQFWAIKGGANYVYRPADKPYWQPGLGIEGLMPYFIDTNLRTYYHDGSGKADLILGRDTQITNNFFIRPEIRAVAATKTVAEDEIGSGLNYMKFTIQPFYRVMPGLKVYAQYEYTQYYGSLKNIRRNAGESTKDDLVSIGFSVLF